MSSPKDDLNAQMVNDKGICFIKGSHESITTEVCVDRSEAIVMAQLAWLAIVEGEGEEGEEAGKGDEEGERESKEEEEGEGQEPGNI